MVQPLAFAAGLDPTLFLPQERLSHYSVDGVVPSLAVRPRTGEEVSKVLAAAHSEGLAVVPWGGGTRMALGGVPSAYHLALDITGVDQPVEHSPSDLTVRVGAGVRLSHLQGVLARHGQFLPLDPPLPQRATIGGILATASYGPLCAGYGLPRDMVIGMEVAHTDGTRSRSGGQVVKNVTGYELHRLYTGSLGTLAVIVGAIFKVAPLPKDERTVVAAFPLAEGALGAGLEAVQRGLSPLAVEMFTDAAWSLVPKGALPLAPEGQGAFWLLLRFGGPPPAVARQEQDALALCQRWGAFAYSVEVLKGEQGRALWAGVADWGWAEPVPPLGVRISCLPRQGVQVLALLDRMIEAFSLSPGVAVHGSMGVLRVFWPSDKVLEDTSRVVSALQGLREQVRSLGGRMIVERAPRPVKELLDPWDVSAETLPLHRSLKTQFDPKGILNPGRFVGGI